MISKRGAFSIRNTISGSLELQKRTLNEEIFVFSFPNTEQILKKQVAFLQFKGCRRKCPQYFFENPDVTSGKRRIYPKISYIELDEISLADIIEILKLLCNQTRRFLEKKKQYNATLLRNNVCMGYFKKLYIFVTLNLLQIVHFQCKQIT